MTNNIIIVGKPNVGKSSLFNALVKKKLALVDNRPRYTRDIKKKNFVFFDHEVTLIDSPGLFEPKDKIEEKIIQYTKDQISKSDLILFLWMRGFAKQQMGNIQGACIDWQEVKRLGDKEVINELNLYCD